MREEVEQSVAGHGDGCSTTDCSGVNCPAHAETAGAAASIAECRYGGLEQSLQLRGLPLKECLLQRGRQAASVCARPTVAMKGRAVTPALSFRESFSLP